MEKGSIVFHPMSELPERDRTDHSFSKTVLVYNEQLDLTELGYFDFEDECWYHFGSDSFLLKCWCYIPNPAECLREHREWPLVRHKDYKEPLYVKKFRIKANLPAGRQVIANCSEDAETIPEQVRHDKVLHDKNN